MWRQGEWLYTLLVLGVLLAEGWALGRMAGVFLERLFGLAPYGQAYAVLLQGVVLTGLSLLLLSAYILLYHALTGVAEQRARREKDLWVTRFTEALFGGAPLPPPPWPKPTLEALLHMREVLKGAEARQVQAWLEAHPDPWQQALRRRFASRATRLRALDALAQARLPQAVPLVLPYLTHPDPLLRLVAARAAARSAPPEALGGLAEALLYTGLPRGALLEVLLLLEDRAAPVLERLLDAGGAREAWAALEAAGRLRLLALAGAVSGFLAHPDPELKAAALRALLRLGYPPDGHEAAVLEALDSPQEFLRIHAVRLLPLLSPAFAEGELWKRLGDPSFYVRRAAAEALAQTRPALLEHAAAEHPDRYGRDMAAQVLRER